MTHRMEICLKRTLRDPAGQRIMARVATDLGFELRNLRVGDGFIIDRALSRDDLLLVTEEVFRDTVVHEASIDDPLDMPYDWLIEVGFRPGVTDNVGRTAREAVERTLRFRFTPEQGVYTRSRIMGQVWFYAVVNCCSSLATRFRSRTSCASAFFIRDTRLLTPP